jgi:hypothetical protein
MKLGMTQVALVRKKAVILPAAMACIADIYARCGDEAEAERIVDKHALTNPSTPITNYRRALLWLSIGNDDAALASLSSACDNHEVEVMWRLSDPRLHRVRNTPQFAACKELTLQKRELALIARRRSHSLVSTTANHVAESKPRSRQIERVPADRF